MKTHTIRKMKGNNGKIITFTPKFFEKMLTCDELAVSLMMYNLRRNIQRITGIACTFDNDQHTQLELHFHVSALNLSPDVDYIHRIFLKGVECTSIDTERSLDLFNTYANMIKSYDSKKE